MPLYKPSELRLFLDSLGIVPKKRLSQNFLLDGNIINKIIKLADVSEGDVVLEIGPGPGALTEALLNTGTTIIAVEKDQTFATALRRLEPEGTRLNISCDDFMNLELEPLLSQFAKGRKAKVIANLPYHLTTPIMIKLIPLNHLFSSITVMVQEEVARRFAAIPGSKIYGSITLFLNFYSQPEYGFRVSKNCFYPKPNVESAVVKFTLHPHPPGINPDSFFALTRQAFCHRRKMLHKSLEELYEIARVQEALIYIGKPIQSRPENLSLDDFIAIFERLKG